MSNYAFTLCNCRHNIDVKCIKNYNDYIKNHRKWGECEEGSY